MITTISIDYHWELLSRLQDSLGHLGSHSHILMQFFWTISFASLETAKRMACTHSVAHVLIQKETQFTAPVTPVSLKIKAQADLSCLFMAIHNLSEEEVKKYEEAFRPLDKDGSGVGCVQTRVFFRLMTRLPPWLKGCSVDCFHWFQLHGPMPWPREVSHAEESSLRMTWVLWWRIWERTILQRSFKIWSMCSMQMDIQLWNFQTFSITWADADSVRPLTKNLWMLANPLTRVAVASSASPSFVQS